MKKINGKTIYQRVQELTTQFCDQVKNLVWLYTDDEVDKIDDFAQSVYEDKVDKPWIEKDFL